MIYLISLVFSPGKKYPRFGYTHHPADESLYIYNTIQDERPVYSSFTAGELKNIVGRKWKYREGTLLDEKDLEEEKNEAKIYPTQDDIIADMFKLKQQSKNAKSFFKTTGF